MTPPQLSNAITFADAAGSTIPVRRRSGTGFITARGDWGMCNGTSYFAFKNISIPKLIVPTGLDSAGRPTAVAFWGRALPAEKLYDDAFARTFDLDFLYKVKPLVDLIQAEPSLRRADATLVADLFRA
eukprot:gnl/TRDRNA2_/TRDRNA2_61310_c0_seq1.p1 gnl/TRDRNA2_/TRDRNA2_61310_c0~~gnl/TRDRNA2_/TRDRNA2_61310_c0_seq1.p1  ORF type:complete len:128 (-),score=28.41 gnl/TRDRNA2_/TRDRNA2_61310_c0_seq1:6-389(-)